MLLKAKIYTCPIDTLAVQTATLLLQGIAMIFVYGLYGVVIESSEGMFEI